MINRGLSDGTYVSDKIPVSRAKPDGGHHEMYGVYQGVINEIVYPDDSKQGADNMLFAVQYVVKVKGAIYRNARDMRYFGGIFDHSIVIRKPTENSVKGQEDKLDRLKDGELVYVMFVDGHADYPVIIGAAHHIRSGEYLDKRAMKARGRYFEQEFNGIEVLIDKDGTYKVSIVGKKSDDKGTISNQGAVGSVIILDGITGDITLQDVHGNIIKLSNNILTITAQKDVTGTVPGALTLNVTGDVNVNTSGKANVVATGDAKVKGSNVTVEATVGITLKAPLNALSGKVVTDNAANSDPITGIPLQGLAGVTGSI